MDAAESRVETVLVGCGAAASTAFFWWVYGPGLLSAAPGTSIRAMAVLPALAGLLGYVGWVAWVFVGLRQLIARPRWYGLVTIGFGVAQFAAVPLAMQQLMRARGIEWGS